MMFRIKKILWLVKGVGVFLFFGVLFCPWVQARSDNKVTLHRIDEVIPEARQSPYSTKLFKLLKNWPPKLLPRLSHYEKGEWLRGIKTPEKSLYIGHAKEILIQSPLAVVANLIEGFEAYSDFFQDLKGVRVTQRDLNLVSVFYERFSPVFFVPNIKYEQVYIVDRSNKKRIVYRYQLKVGNSLNFTDGLIVLESEGNSTRLSGFDFFDASWGLAGMIAESRIWRESLEGTVKGDFALKFKAEHPNWTFDQITKESEQMLNHFPVEPIQYVELPDLESP